MRVLLTLVLACGVVTGVASGAARETVFADAFGDSGAALDVTSVDVADTGTGLGFRIPFANPAPGADDVVEILLNTDQNKATGRARDGADWMIFFRGGDPASFGVARFDGETLTTVHFDDAQIFWSRGLEFDIAKTDLGINERFDFSVVTSVGLPIQQTNSDHAPDTGMWTYTATGIRAGITYDSVVATAAKKPRTGKPFELQVSVKLVSATESALRAPDALTCTATVAKKKLKTAIAVRSQTAATCRMTIPKKTKGKTLSVSLGARYGAVTKNAKYAAKIGA